MNTFARRDHLLEEFTKESKGSFSTVYRALSEVAKENKSGTLKEDDVRARIKEIVKDRETTRDSNRETTKASAR